METFYTIVSILIFYVFSIWVSLMIDSECEKIDKHHNESIWWLLIPAFNMPIQLIFLLVVLTSREKRN